MPISDRHLFLAGLGLLTGACSSEKAPDPVAVAPAEDRIECALAGAAGFGRDCSVERIDSDEGIELILHHRDGGFRRLRVSAQGLVSSDGAELPKLSEAGDRIEIELGGDRYRLSPAAMGVAEPSV